MKRTYCFGLALAVSLGAQVNLRPPATPLIAHDPYFSVWATGDTLTAQPTKHWTGADHQLAGGVRMHEHRQHLALEQARQHVDVHEEV